MKKCYLLIVFLLVLILPLKINAKEINDFACNYHIECIDPINYGKVDLGYMQVMYTGYDDGNYEGGAVTIFYGETSDKLETTVTPNSKTKNFKNYGFGKKNRQMYLLSGDSKGINIAYRFSFTSDCPDLYCGVNNDYIHISNDGDAQTGVYTSNNPMPATQTFLRNKSEDEWKTKNEFYSSGSNPGTNPGADPGTTTTTPKEPLTCTYALKPQGEYYGGSLNNSVIEEIVDVVLTTSYNPTTGNIQSYNVTANGAGPNTPFTTLNNEVRFTFTGKRNSAKFEFIVRPEQLKKVFAGRCLDQSELYLYMNKNEVSADVWGYVLTTSKSEMDNEIMNQDYDYGEKDPIQIEPPGIRDGNLSTCESILGSNLTKIVRVSITIIQVAGAIIAIVKGMMVLIPPLLAKDAEALKKSLKTLTTMAIILVIIFLFKPILSFLGNILDFDVSCII